jgi:hypothetical protein
MTTLTNGLALISHQLSAATRDKATSTLLRLLTVLDPSRTSAR